MNIAQPVPITAICKYFDVRRVLIISSINIEFITATTSAISLCSMYQEESAYFRRTILRLLYIDITKYAERLNGYVGNVERKMWYSWRSTYPTCIRRCVVNILRTCVLERIVKPSHMQEIHDRNSYLALTFFTVNCTVL